MDRYTQTTDCTNGIVALCNCSSSKSFEIPDKGCSPYDHHHATPVNRLLFTGHGVLCNTDKSQVQVERSFPYLTFHSPEQLNVGYRKNRVFDLS